MRNYLEELGLQHRHLMDRYSAWSMIKRFDGRFYVYIIWSVIGDDVTPFYVGKGTGRRFANHLSPSNHAGNDLKARAIAATKAAGGSFAYTFPLTGVDETEAHRVEQRMIAKIGRAQTKHGPLTNRTDGGDGSLGCFQPKGRASKKLRRVIISGIEYPGLVVAAEETGQSYSMLLMRIRKGWPGYYYVDEGPRPCRKRDLIKPHQSRAVIANGSRYDTLSAASTALGIGLTTVFKRINAGWPGYYYEDEGQKPRSKPSRGSPEHMAAARSKIIQNARSVTVHGRQYHSLSAAGRAAGVSYATIRKRANDPTNPAYVFTQ